jgi:hypothetical protein
MTVFAQHHQGHRDGCGLLFRAEDVLEEAADLAEKARLFLVRGRLYGRSRDCIGSRIGSRDSRRLRRVRGA